MTNTFHFRSTGFETLSEKVIYAFDPLDVCFLVVVEIE